MGGVPIRAALLRHLEQHAGTRVYRKDIAESLKETEKRVLQGIQGLIATGEPITVDVRGQAWTYKPNAANSKAVYEYLATAKDGRLVLQGEGGQLLIATEL